MVINSLSFLFPYMGAAEQMGCYKQMVEAEEPAPSAAGSVVRFETTSEEREARGRAEELKSQGT